MRGFGARGCGLRAACRSVPRSEPTGPKSPFPVIERLADAGVPADRACRVLGAAQRNYYLAKRAPTTATQLRRQWLTGLIREVHVASRATSLYRRVHAELTLGMGVTICQQTVSVPDDPCRDLRA